MDGRRGHLSGSGLETEMISEATIDQIQSRVSYPDVVSERNIEVTPSGSEYQAPCPFHGDSNPSLKIGPRVAHCFGCGWKGNVFQFIIKHDGVPFSEAVRECARRASVKIDNIDFHELEIQNEIDERNQEVFASILKHTVAAYAKSKAARDYAAKRGIDASVAKTAQAGYGSKDILKKILADGHSQSDLESLGVMNRKGNFRLADRLIFPIVKDGKILNFYGRAINPKNDIPHLYLKGNEGVYNVDITRVYPSVYCVESIIDSLVMMSKSIPNVIAQLGTQGLKDRFISGMKQAGVSHISLLPDHDAPKKGKKNPESFIAAAKTMGRILAEGIGASIELVPGRGKDPADHFLSGGTLNDLIPFAPYDWMTKCGLDPKNNMIAKVTSTAKDDNREFTVETNDLGTWIVEKSASGVSGLRALLTIEVKGSELYRDQVTFYAQQKRRGIAKDTGFDIDDVNRICRAIEAQYDLIIDSEKKEPEKDRKKRTPQYARQLAEDLKRHPNIIDEVISDITKLGYVGEDNNKALLYLVGVSAAMSNPLGAYIAAESSAGKSALTDKVVSLFPPDRIFFISRMTAHALYYVGEDDLRHKWIIVAERKGAEDEQADYSIRTLFSEKVLTLMVPTKDETTGDITTKRKTVYGPIAYTETTTDVGIHDENATRLVELNIREDPRQTALIHEYMRDEASADQSEMARIEKESKRIKAKHQAFIESLEALDVRIPYAKMIEFPVNLTRARRDFPKFLGIIKAVAFVHQHQRKIHVQGGVRYIDATVEDYGVAYRIADDAIRKAFAALPERSLEILKSIFDAIKDPRTGEIDTKDPDACSFTIKEVREAGVEKAATTIKKYLEPLIESGIIEVVDEGGRGRGRASRYKMLIESIDEARDPNAGKILTEEQLRKRIEDGDQVQDSDSEGEGDIDDWLFGGDADPDPKPKAKSKRTKPKEEDGDDSFEGFDFDA